MDVENSPQVEMATSTTTRSLFCVACAGSSEVDPLVKVRRKRHAGLG